MVTKALWQLPLRARNARKTHRIQKSFNTATVVDTVHGFSVALDPHNGLVDETIFDTKDWDPELITLLGKHITPSTVLLDVGANIGFVTLFAASRAKEGHVHAFEPIKHLAEQIEKSVDINSFSNVTVHNVACGSARGTAQISVPAKNSGGASIARAPKDSQDTLSIDVAPVDEMMYQKVDIIKIDVEGFELQALMGMKETISTHKPKIFIEYSPALLPAGDDHKIMKFLFDHGYLVRDIRTGLEFKGPEKWDYKAQSLIGQTDLFCY